MGKSELHVLILLFRRYNGKTRINQNSTLLLLPVPDNSASQSHLSSCDDNVFIQSIFTLRRYASAGNSDRNVSVCSSVCHEPVLCQNEE